MFYIYADGKLLNQPLEDSLVVMTPRLILEMGKAGSLEFALPPNNVHYQDLRKLKTLVTVDLDDTELFRGRVLSHDRNFNNVKKIYAEGDLAYLVDSVQKAGQILWYNAWFVPSDHFRAQRSDGSPKAIRGWNHRNRKSRNCHQRSVGRH